MTAAWDALAALYPEASIVILGPAPQVLPVQAATARIDADLAELAAARGWWYVSPIAEDWITPANYAAVIDTGIGRDHPSTDGHAYLATRLAEALATLERGHRMSPPTRLATPSRRDLEATDLRASGGNLDRYASVAQGIERWFPVPKVAGSIPVGGTDAKSRPQGRLFCVTGCARRA